MRRHRFHVDTNPGQQDMLNILLQERLDEGWVRYVIRDKYDD